MRLQFLMDLRPIRLRMLAPNRGIRPLRKDRLLDLLLPPIIRQRPLYASSLRCRHILMDGALGNGTTAGDLMLAQSERLKPQNFLQLAHGQPLLWQLGVSTYPVESNRHGYLRRRSNPMPITIPNYNRKTDRLQFGTLIGITSE